MNPETLRIACEEAGLDCGPDGCFVKWSYGDGPEDWDMQFLEYENPAFRAYVASLLWEKIPLDMCEYCVYPRSVDNSIMACLDVLRPGWRDETV